LDQPEVEFVVEDVTEARRDRSDIVVQIVDQVTGMDPEETRQQGPGVAGEVAPGAALDLGEVGLADAAAQCAADGGADLDLSHLAVEAAGVSLEGAQAGELIAESHNNQQYIAGCYISQAAPLSLAISMTSDRTAAAVGMAPAPLPTKNISPAA